jgi:DNA-binding GntR family transcriptional regulator
MLGRLAASSAGSQTRRRKLDRLSGPDEARTLELTPGVPVVQMLPIDYDQDGRTLQVADDLYAADRHEFAFEWTEPDGPYE